MSSTRKSSQPRCRQIHSNGQRRDVEVNEARQRHGPPPATITASSLENLEFIPDLSPLEFFSLGGYSLRSPVVLASTRHIAAASLSQISVRWLKLREITWRWSSIAGSL